MDLDITPPNKPDALADLLQRAEANSRRSQRLRLVSGGLLAAITLAGGLLTLQAIKANQEAALKAELSAFAAQKAQARANEVILQSLPSAISPSGKFLARASLDGVVAIYAADRSAPILHITLEAPATAISFAPDGMLIGVATDNQVHIYRIIDGAEIVQADFENNVRSLSYSKNSNYMFVQTADGEVAQLDLQTGTLVRVSNFPLSPSR